MKRKYINHSVLVFISLVIFHVIFSCKSNEDVGPNLGFVISTSLNIEDKIENPLVVDVAGGKDTLFIHTNKEFNIKNGTSDKEEWIIIENVQKISNEITQIIFEYKPLSETFDIRTNVLSLTNEDLSGTFLTISQGYTNRFKEKFDWLRYGVFNPLDEGREVLMKNWTVAQIANGWTSTIGEDQTESNVFGRFEHVKIGTSEYGADLISRNIGGIDRDSILVLSFNAVGYTPLFGERDAHQLQIEIENGSLFLDGTTTKIIELNSFDAESALLDKTFWNNSFHSFYLKKPENNTTVSTIRVKFTTGTSIKTPKNRVFVDNFNIHTVEQYVK